MARKRKRALSKKGKRVPVKTSRFRESLLNALSSPSTLLLVIQLLIEWLIEWLKSNTQ